MNDIVPALGNYMLHVPDYPDWIEPLVPELYINTNSIYFLKDQWMTKHLYERINNTTKWIQTGEESKNMIHGDKMLEYYEQIRDAEFEAVRRNYNSVGPCR